MTEFKSLSRWTFFNMVVVLMAIFPACQQTKTIKTMNNMERAEAKSRYLTEKNNDSAVKVLELMLKDSTDLNERRGIMLELADLYFDTKAFAKAGAMYKEFAKYYSGSDKAEYALYRATVCAFNMIASAEKDQTKTIEAIDLAKSFLERAEIFSTYAPEVEKMLGLCQERLFESEMNVVNFYISRSRLVSAAKRIDGVRKEFIPILAKSEESILLSECVLADRLNNPELILAKQAELIQKFPASQATVLAQNLQGKGRSFANRF